MIIPSLTLNDIAEWKQGVEYKVVCCSSKDTQQKLGKWNQDDSLKQIKWESHGDAELATTVLTEYVKALADSLNQHWDSFFTKVTDYHSDFEAKKGHIQGAKKLLDDNGGKVEVQELKKVHLWRHKKFFKIDVGELYDDEDLK